MSARKLHLAVAQLGPVQRADTRAQVVRRLVELLNEAGARGARWVTFPELALTTFFPRWSLDDPAEVRAFFETRMPGPDTQPLFDAARARGHRLLSRLCGTGRRYPVQHQHPGGPRRPHHRQVPQDPYPG